MSETGSLLNNLFEQFSAYTKEGLENLSSSIIIIFSLSFIHIYIIDVNKIAEYFGILFYPLLVLTTYLIKIIIFSNDYLLYGDKNNKYVKAFTNQLPSKYLVDKLEIEKRDALFYWFRIYNLWQKEDSDRYEETKRTFKRGYACRFIFYTIKLFDFLISVSFLTLLFLSIYIFIVNQKIFLFENSEIMISYTLFLIILRIIIVKFNNHKEGEYSGVWKKWESINNNHKKWIDDNIKDKKDLENYIENSRQEKNGLIII